MGKKPQQDSQKTIELGGGFEFRFGASPFAPKNPLHFLNTSETNQSLDSSFHDILGWEYCAGELVHPALERVFKKLKLHLFLLPETSLQAAALVQNVFQLSGSTVFKPDGSTPPQFEFDHVFIDIPSMASPHLAAVVKSFPHCVALAEASVVPGGVFSGLGMDAAEQLHNRPVCYFESLDCRRLFLTRLLERSELRLTPPHSQVHAFGGTDVFLQWRLLSEVQQTLLNFPPEMLLSSGLLPFLEGRLFLAHKQLQGTFSAFLHEPAQQLFEDLSKLPEKSKVLVVADAPFLLALTRMAQESSMDDLSLPLLANARRIRELKNRGAAQLWAMSPENNSEFARVPGFLSQHVLQQSKVPDSYLNPFDVSRKGLVEAFQKASLKYEDWTKLKMTRAQERDYFRFAHRLAAEEGLLFPRTFDLLLAARSVVDSNFAFELLQLCRDYPTNKTAEASLSVLDVPFRELFQKTTVLSVGQFETIQRHKPRKSLRSVKSQKRLHTASIPVSENKYADNSWVHSDHPYSCSFPDEDIFMEDFAFAYRKQAREMVRARETHLSELQSSLKDGLDLRETVRHWHSQKIIVREELNVGKADVGSVVFHFAEPGEHEKYNWKSFWLAERHDNSNLMFFATPFQDNLIGPGIAKSEFGGFAVIPLPSYSENPWNDAFIRGQAQTPAEALLLAGALATEHRTVLYIDNHPPSRRIADLLKRSGKTILHVRLAELPPEKIRRVKTFHILAEAGVREYAEKYIRKE